MIKRKQCFNWLQSEYHGNQRMGRNDKKRRYPEAVI